jgi:hypothetical protein
MEPLTREQWQSLWNRRAKTSREVSDSTAINDWLFELITEAGYDVRDDVVIKL